MSLYSRHGDTWPPSEEEWLYSPLRTIATFMSRVANSEDFTTIIEGQEFALSQLQEATQDMQFTTSLLKYRKAQKHIYSCVVSTLTVGSSMIHVRRCSYGAGMGALQCIRHRQTRQTAMSLFTLINNLMSAKLGPKEELIHLFDRIGKANQRLRNWRPSSD